MSIEKVTNPKSKHYGEWKVRAQPRDAAGKTVSLPVQYCHGTKVDAKKLYRKMIVDFQVQSSYYKEKQLTLVKAFQAFINDNTDVWEPRTKRDYDYTLRILQEYLPNLKMVKVNETVLQRFIRQFAKDHKLSVASGTVLDKRIRHLRYFFNKSVGSLFPHNPVPDSALKRWFRRAEMTAPEQKKLFNGDQLRELTGYIQAQLKKTELADSVALVGLLIALNTGCRPSEIQALRWDDLIIDPTAVKGEFHVFKLVDSYNEAEQKLNGHLKSRMPGQSRYTLPLDEQSFALIQKFKARQTKLLARYKIKNQYHLIMLNLRDFKRAKENRVISQSAMNAMLKRICRKQKIYTDVSKISLYTCRHSIATLTAAKGMNAAWTANRLGHSLEVYLKKYVHPANSLSSDLLAQWLTK